MPLPILSDGEGIKLCVTYPQTFSSEQEEEEILENGHYLCHLRLSHIRDKYWRQKLEVSPDEDLRSKV